MRCARFPGVSLPSRRLIVLCAFAAAALVSLLAAPMALAENGVGLMGPTTDKTVTFFCFGVIGFFALLPIVLTLVQSRLEKRKEQRQSNLQRYS
jgi:hypothetical protein